MTSFSYEEIYSKANESLNIENRHHRIIRIYRRYSVKAGYAAYIEIQPDPDYTGVFPGILDFVLSEEQVDELITHLYNIRNGTNFGGNDEPDS